MKLIILAFIFSIILHLLLFFSPVEKLVQDIRPVNNSKKIDKSTVRYVNLKPKVTAKPKSEPLMAPILKQKKVVNNKLKKVIPPLKKAKKRKVIKKAKKIVSKPKKQLFKIAKRKKITKIKPQEKRKNIPSSSLENFFLSEPVPLNTDMLDKITQSYLKLYGEEYNSFTKVQKVFLQKNLKDIGRITQKYLRYPRIAIRTHQQGMNILEFYLHPNGDISDLKIINSSSYTTLDKNSIETIEIAYKDYPRPKTKTKIRIYIRYILY